MTAEIAWDECDICWKPLPPGHTCYCECGIEVAPVDRHPPLPSVRPLTSKISKLRDPGLRWDGAPINTTKQRNISLARRARIGG